LSPKLQLHKRAGVLAPNPTPQAAASAAAAGPPPRGQARLLLRRRRRDQELQLVVRAAPSRVLRLRAWEHSLIICVSIEAVATRRVVKFSGSRRQTRRKAATHAYCHLSFRMQEPKSITLPAIAPPTSSWKTCAQQQYAHLEAGGHAAHVLGGGCLAAASPPPWGACTTMRERAF